MRHRFASPSTLLPLLLLAIAAPSCGGEADPMPDTGASCPTGQTWCASCDGSGGSCVDGACGPCPDTSVGRDTGAADTGGMDAGATDAGGGDSGRADAGVADAAGGDGSGPCQAGTCRLSEGGACEEPSGPTGNGCCECAAGFCTSFCRCLATDTPIATPSGDVPVSELSVGDLVYSVDGDAIVAVPLARAERVRAEDHSVVHLRLEDGRELFVSPGHPLADGGLVRSLVAGGRLDGAQIVEAALVPYPGAYTYDILPASETGTYFAAGLPLGSTLPPLRPDRR